MKWETVQISEFCKTGTGGTPSRSNMERYYEGGTIPWVKSGELRENIITDTGEHVTEAALKETSIKLVPAGALLLALYGATVGRLGILGVEATTNQAVCHIIPDPQKANVRYLFHALSNQVSNLVARGVGGAQPNISQGIVKELGLMLPPLAEQKRIAAILDAADALRAKRREALAQLDALLQSTFLTLFGDPVSNPMGWANDSLTKHGSFKNGLNYGKSENGIEVTCLGVGNFGSRSRIDDVSKLPTLSLNSMPPKEYLLKEGDIVFVRSNGNKALVGRCLSIHPNDTPVTFGGFCIRYRIEDSQLVATFLTHLFRTASMKSCMLQGGQGANIQNINQKILGDLAIPLPPLPRQQKFAAIVESIERQKDIQRTHLAELDALFAALQHRAFRGEL